MLEEGGRREEGGGRREGGKREEEGGKREERRRDRKGRRMGKIDSPTSKSTEGEGLVGETGKEFTVS